MKIISHRGNINGIIPERENSPSYIDCAILNGLEVEVDVRFIEGRFWLGHDAPQYRVEINWLENRKDKLWLHCKNLEASQKLIELNSQFKFFCHNNDPYILTSTGHIWIHDLSLSLNENSIIPLLSEIDIENFNGNITHAVCTDFTTYCKHNLRLKGLC